MKSICAKNNFVTYYLVGTMFSPHQNASNALRTTTSYHSFACQDALVTVFPVLEQFLNIRETVAMSMTCHGLRNEIIDKTTAGIKISHFDTSSEALAEILPNDNVRTTSVFLANALTRIHFPSLLSLDIDLSSVRQAFHLQDILSSLVVKFPLATKLRELRFEAVALLTLPTRLDLAIRPMTVALVRNLEECCPDLVELDISVGSWASVYRRNPIGDFVRMLREVLCKRKETLEKFSFSWEFEFDEEEDLDAADDVIRLFTSIFELESLHSLSVDLHCGFMSEMMLRAAESNRRDEGSSRITSLQNLIISMEEDQDEFASECSYAPLLDYFNEFTGITQLNLSLPRRCFQESRSLSAWKKFVVGRQHITHLMLGFDSYSDDDDWIVEVLVTLLEKLKLLVFFHCWSLMNVNRKLLIVVINKVLRERGHKLKDVEIMIRNGRRRILMEDLLVVGPKRLDCHEFMSETPSNSKFSDGELCRHKVLQHNFTFVVK
ncbi:hypothetical protein ACHAXS_003581 [Conticribra weissflogii]